MIKIQYKIYHYINQLLWFIFINNIYYIKIPQIEDSLHHLIELKNSSQDICEDVNNKITKSYQQPSDSLTTITSTNNVNLSKIKCSGKEIVEPQYILKALSSSIS